MEDPTARILAAHTPEEVRAVAAEIAESAAKIEVELSATKRARELLLNGVAHDLRNPLNTFAMSVGLLKDDVERGDMDPARALALVKRMERSTHKMQVLVDDLLEASRVEARTIELALRVERAVIVVQNAVAKAQPLGEERHIRISVGDVDADAKINVDVDRAAQALVKLLAYTLKSTGEGGTIKVSVAKEETTVTIALRAVAPAGAPVSAPLDVARGGLSLLIGRGLFEMHDARVDVEPDGVTIRLPSTG